MNEGKEFIIHPLLQQKAINIYRHNLDLNRIEYWDCDYHAWINSTLYTDINDVGKYWECQIVSYNQTWCEPFLL